MFVGFSRLSGSTLSILSWATYNHIKSMKSDRKLRKKSKKRPKIKQKQVFSDQKNVQLISERGTPGTHLQIVAKLFINLQSMAVQNIVCVKMQKIRVTVIDTRGQW